MTDEDISPMPTPHAEEPQLVPGGVDAIEDDPADNGLSRDLDPDDNPAVDDVLPDEVAAPDDKPQAPEGQADDQESGTTEAAAHSDAEADSDSDSEPDAGQEAEDGSVEPPA